MTAWLSFHLKSCYLQSLIKSSAKFAYFETPGIDCKGFCTTHMYDYGKMIGPMLASLSYRCPPFASTPDRLQNAAHARI